MTMSIALQTTKLYRYVYLKKEKKRERKYVNRKKQPKKVCIKRYIDKRK